MRSGERDRISLSHAAAVAEPSLSQLAAPPSAQRRRDKLRAKNKLGEMLGWMAPPRKREAKPPKRQERTSAEPTPERAAKEPDYGSKIAAFHQILHSGGQVAHQTRVFSEVYDRHVSDSTREAMDLLLRGYEIAQRARSTSSRAYTGAPYTGQSPEHEGHVALTEQDRRDLELFSWAWTELTAETSEWADRLKAHVLRITSERTGKLQSVHELGASRTGYAKGSDNAQAAGVMAVLDAALRWKEALQAGAMKLQYARMRRRAAHEDELLRYTAEQKTRQERANALRRERNEHFAQYYITKRKP